MGLEKREALQEMFGPKDVEFMVRIHKSVDPLQLANRGKMFVA